VLWSTARCGLREAINLVEPLRVRFWHDRGQTIAQIGLLFTLHHQDRLSVARLRTNFTPVRQHRHGSGGQTRSRGVREPRS